MKELFYFTENEISILIINELVRLGKVDPNGKYGIITQYDYNLGKLKGRSIQITDPIPGAPNIK